MAASAERRDARAATLTAEVVDDPDRLEELAPAWEELAGTCAQPSMLPGWLIPWWRRVAPAGSRLRAIAVHDGGELAGLAPFYAPPPRRGRVDYRLLGAGTTQYLAPLARSGAEQEVAAATASALAGCRPAPRAIALEAVAAATSWPETLAAAYPGRFAPRVCRRLVIPGPAVTLAGRTFDSWLEERSSRFRKRTRGTIRAAERAGAVIRQTDADRCGADVDALVRLHRARWAGDGGSRTVTAGVPEMVLDAVRRSLGTGALRLWVMELGGRVVGAELMMAAGGVVSAWNGGYDPAHAALSPSIRLLLAAIDDGMARGERTLWLGSHAHPYKMRLADTDEPVTNLTIRPVTGRYALTAASFAPADARWAVHRAFHRLPPGVQPAVRRVLGPLRDRLPQAG